MGEPRDQVAAMLDYAMLLHGRLFGGQAQARPPGGPLARHHCTVFQPETELQLPVRPLVPPRKP
jgi:hypothetical protein